MRLQDVHYHRMVEVTNAAPYPDLSKKTLEEAVQILKEQATVLGLLHLVGRMARRVADKGSWHCFQEVNALCRRRTWPLRGDELQRCIKFFCLMCSKDMVDKVKLGTHREEVQCTQHDAIVDGTLKIHPVNGIQGYNIITNVSRSIRSVNHLNVQRLR